MLKPPILITLFMSKECINTCNTPENLYFSLHGRTPFTSSIVRLKIGVVPYPTTWGQHGIKFAGWRCSDYLLMQVLYNAHGSHFTGKMGPKENCLENTGNFEIYQNTGNLYVLKL